MIKLKTVSLLSVSMLKPNFLMIKWFLKLKPTKTLFKDELSLKIIKPNKVISKIKE